MDTLPDLRVTIAEGMEALAAAQPRFSPDAPAVLAHRARAGAQTLRWCAAREAPSIIEDLQDDIADLKGIIMAVEDVCLGNASPTKRLAAIRNLVA